MVVVSGTRSPQEQAAAMYKKFEGRADMSICKDQRALGEVRVAFSKGVQSGMSKGEIIDAMSRVLDDQVEEGRLISAHMGGRAADIHIPQGAARRAALIKSIRASGGAMIHEVTPPHYHIQIKKAR